MTTAADLRLSQMPKFIGTKEIVMTNRNDESFPGTRQHHDFIPILLQIVFVLF